jgi:hypothetical protein
MNRTDPQPTTHQEARRTVRHGRHPTRAERNRPRRKSTHTIPPARRLPHHPYPA